MIPGLLLEVHDQSEKPISWRTKHFYWLYAIWEVSSFPVCKITLFYEITVAFENQLNTGFPLSLSSVFSFLCETTYPPTHLEVFFLVYIQPTRFAVSTRGYLCRSYSVHPQRVLQFFCQSVFIHLSGLQLNTNLLPWSHTSAKQQSRPYIYWNHSTTRWRPIKVPVMPNAVLFLLCSLLHCQLIMWKSPLTQQLCL